MPYIVVDKTPDKKCTKYIHDKWGPILSQILSKRLEVEGDAFVIRDDLLEGGFKWGKDFYIKKLDE